MAPKRRGIYIYIDIDIDIHISVVVSSDEFVHRAPCYPSLKYLLVFLQELSQTCTPEVGLRSLQITESNLVPVCTLSACICS